MSTKLCAGIFAALLVFVDISAALAVDQKVILRLGKYSTIQLDRAFETVIVGNPEILDVHSDGVRTAVLEPLRPGGSNVIFVDDHSMVIANVRVFVCHLVGSAFREGSDCD